MATHLCPGSIGELGCQLALAGENSQLASGSRSGPLALLFLTRGTLHNPGVRGIFTSVLLTT